MVNDDRTLGSGGKDGRPNLQLGEGETVTLAPDAPRYSRFYTEHRPTRLAELQTLIGVKPVADARRLQGRCCADDELSATLVNPDDLQSDDPNVKAKADRLTYLAARDYLSGRHDVLQAWEPAISAWIELKRPVLWVAALHDIVVENGATLNLSANTHSLVANTIIIYGSGRINCHGPTKIKAVSLNGVRHKLVVGSAVSSAAKNKITSAARGKNA